jgi:oligoendopeptidase F
MELLKRAGVDLGEPETVRAVIDQLDVLVTKLEKELEQMKALGTGH